MTHAATTERPRRLTALDTSFLHAESPRSPMHVAALVVLDGGSLRDADGRFRLEDARNYLVGRLHLAPRLRQVVRDVPLNLGRPVWVDDVDFDLSHHVRLLQLPAPGDQAALLRLTEEVMMTCLDRTRPLWEWWFIDGLANGQVALIEKVHHCLIDGVSGVQIMAALSDLADFAPPEKTTWAPASPPSSQQLVADALGELVQEPWRIAGDLMRLGQDVADQAWSLLRPRSPADLFRRPSWEPGALRSRGLGTRRTLTPLTLPLTTIKQVGHAHDTKVNDVVLSIVTGGLRALLESRGEDLAGQHLHALVPESVRTDDEHLALGNRVGGMFAPLPIDEADPLLRLEFIRDEMRQRRETHQGESTSKLLEAADHLPPTVVRLAIRLVDEQPFVSTVVTNIPGPRQPLSIMGAPVRSMVPVVPLAGKITIGVAVLSYLDDLTIAVHADADANPDIEVMVDGMQSSYEALLEACYEHDVVNRRDDEHPPPD